jgi:hypothetical protein
MVVGRKPFHAKSPLDVLRMHIAEAPPPPRSMRPGCCSVELERAILRALEKPPVKRWQSAVDFARALEATPEGRESSVPLIDLRDRDTGPQRALTPAVERGLPAMIPTPQEPLRVPRRTRRWGQAVLLLLALALGAVAAWARFDPAGAAHLRQRIVRALDGVFG